MSFQQRGFTLVEISIVLIIIALLTGAILSGQRMMEKSRINSLVKEVEAFRAAVGVFQRRYGYLPGDFPRATTELAGNLPTGAVTYNGNGDGQVRGSNLNSDFGDGTEWFHEGPLAIQHLILAGLIKGDPTKTDQRRGVQLGGSIAQIRHIEAHGTYTRLALELNDVPQKYVKLLDKELDDGLGKSGSVRNLHHNQAWPSPDGGTSHMFIEL